MEILADAVASSMEQHARFGGVVPELIWSIDTGKGPGYGDFAERLGVAP